MLEGPRGTSLTYPSLSETLSHVTVWDAGCGLSAADQTAPGTDEMVLGCAVGTSVCHTQGAITKLSATWLRGVWGNQSHLPNSLSVSAQSYVCTRCMFLTACW